MLTKVDASRIKWYIYVGSTTATGHTIYTTFLSIKLLQWINLFRNEVFDVCIVYNDAKDVLLRHSHSQPQPST